jgi:hypothetical protein
LFPPTSPGGRRGKRSEDETRNGITERDDSDGCHNRTKRAATAAATTETTETTIRAAAARTAETATVVRQGNYGK